MADVNGDGFINPEDADMIFDYGVGRIDKFPIDVNYDGFGPDCE